MRFKSPEIGSERILSCFAFMPITIGNECRWLENIKVLQKYELPCQCAACGFDISSLTPSWVNIKFLN